MSKFNQLFKEMQDQESISKLDNAIRALTPLEAILWEDRPLIAELKALTEKLWDKKQTMIKAKNGGKLPISYDHNSGQFSDDHERHSPYA